jgi:hypothetical protein
MIKVTKETIDGLASIIINNKTKKPSEEVDEILKENEYFLKDSLAISEVSGPGFMAGWMTAYCTIKRQIENDQFAKND